MKDEKEYPMTFEEFKKRMIELFIKLELSRGDRNDLSGMEHCYDVVREVTHPDCDLLEGLYGQTCDNYDRGGCEACDNTFDDKWLPVHILDML